MNERTTDVIVFFFMIAVITVLAVIGISMIDGKERPTIAVPNVTFTVPS